MRIGLQVPSFTYPGGSPSIPATLRDIAQAADEAGFYSLWVMDHFFQIPFVGSSEQEMLEGYSTLGYLAAVTRRIKLGTLATGVIYRHPGILVKTATTIDVLSGGRSYFGIGAAWFERECKGLGVPFPPIAQRFEMLEEALQITLQMWSGNQGPYQGRHYQLTETMCSPQPLSRPRPPILIAGGGEKKTLRLVAQYGDACNLFGEPEIVEDKLEVLKQHCERLRRDYRSIEKTTLHTAHLAPGQQSPREIIEKCRALAAVGVDQAIFNLPNVHKLAPLETFAREIIPAVREF